jgi:adenosylmethionine-8-amino-7-oxononanoate aminotransferase
LAAKLCEVAPKGLTRVFYSDSGSTSVEVALKMAYQYWRQSGRPEKRKFAALAEAYHGDTLGSVSVGGIELFHERFEDLLFDVVRIPAPHAYRWAGGDVFAESLSQAEQILSDHAHELAALVVEPLVQGAAGMWLQPRGWLAGIAALCRKHDILLVCDEVATGFGRTGTLFAVEQEAVAPDLLCVAKGLTGGYLPLAATLATDRIYEAFLGTATEGKTFFHGHTYTGNPLACAVALANLGLFESEQTLLKMQPAMDALAKGLERISALAHVGEVRRRGMMVGIELTSDKASRADYPYGDRVGFQVCLAARADQVLIRPLGNVLVLMPPLSVTVEEVELICAAVERAIVKICG